MYIDLASKDGWEPGPEHFMVGMPCSIADSVEQAMATLKSGTKFFLGVLGGGIRTAQRLVLQKTRYYREEAHKERFPGLAARRETPLEELMDKGLVLCGTPDMVVDQIKRAKSELGHGLMNLNIKIGNTPQAAVLETMRHLRDHVFPAVRDV